MPRISGLVFYAALAFVGCLAVVSASAGRVAAQDGNLPETPQLSDDSEAAALPEAGESPSSSGQVPSLLAPERDSLKDFRDDPELLKELILKLPEEAQGEAQSTLTRFRDTNDKLRLAMGELREIQIRYRNDLDRSPAAIIAYREKREEVWGLMQDEFDAALDLIRFLPSSEAASYLVTMVQVHFDTDIYDQGTFEAAARLIDLGQNYRFLYLAGARSAVATGKFKSARQVYDALKDDDLEDADRQLQFHMDILEEQFTEEQAAIAATDPATLPQVRFETTMGSFLVELFPETAPSTVAHFLKLVRSGFYEGMDWSVVTPNVLALTGDTSNDGRGNSGEFLVDEHESEGNRNALRGSLIMAKIPLGKGEFIPNSASSQFAIPYLPITSVSTNQTVFGRVIEGMDVVSRLRRVDPTKEKKKNEVQLPPDSIISAEIVRDAEDLPDPQYVDLQKEMEKAVKAGLLQSTKP
ncbi:peptidylprolyl isomerase [Neorhodopirellula pilleata]|nr:peptidylprolyl isomerase [Neorhodopirellula pilleata]